MFNQTTNIEYTYDSNNSINIKWLNSKTKKYRNSKGQFFTENNIISYIKTLLYDIKNNHDISFNSVLEPSFGSGNLLNLIYEIYNDFNISCVSGFEIDKELYELYIDYISDKNNIYNLNLVNDDYLMSQDMKYDLIISNPPYICMNEICKTSPDSYNIIKERYKFSGKYNIYFLFIEKIINSLNENGIAVFIIPTSFMSCPSCNDIRYQIIKNFTVLDIKYFGKFSKEVAQDVMVMTIKKTIPQNLNYVVKIKDSYILSYNRELLNIDKTVRDLNVKITVGKVVWNQHKDKLSDVINTGYILVYSHNIINDKFQIVNHETKKQYINISDKYSESGFKILMKRAPVNGKFMMIKSQKNICAENHILVIRGSISNLNLFYKNMKLPQVVDFIKSISGTTHMSIENIYNLPYYI